MSREPARLSWRARRERWRTRLAHGCCSSGQGQNRTADTVIFSHVLYQLSYLAPAEGCVLDRSGAVQVNHRSRPAMDPAHSRPGSTNSPGLDEPLPKKNFSISVSRNLRDFGSTGVSRYSLISMI